MAIKCPKCQSKNPETAVFCADCGTKLISPMGIDVTKTMEAPREELTRGTTNLLFEKLSERRKRP